jgi:hypothetical protein
MGSPPLLRCPSCLNTYPRAEWLEHWRQASNGHDPNCPGDGSIGYHTDSDEPISGDITRNHARAITPPPKRKSIIGWSRG